MSKLKKRGPAQCHNCQHKILRKHGMEVSDDAEPSLYCHNPSVCREGCDLLLEYLNEAPCKGELFVRIPPMPEEMTHPEIAPDSRIQSDENGRLYLMVFCLNAKRPIYLDENPEVGAAVAEVEWRREFSRLVSAHGARGGGKNTPEISNAIHQTDAWREWGEKGGE